MVIQCCPLNSMSRIGWLPCTGGRGKLLNEQQEQEICNMVMAKNAITLRQIRAAILQDNAIFQNVSSISISTIDRILKKHQMTMKQLYRVPFVRNFDRVKELRYQYVHVSQLLVVYHYNLFTVKRWFPNFFGFSAPFTWFLNPSICFIWLQHFA